MAGSAIIALAVALALALAPAAAVFVCAWAGLMSAIALKRLWRWTRGESLDF